ncbi:MAG: rRNA pseudouridine synthase [Ignavibacteriaceae bacterium]|nr:rRNA pseudouridine synthase [Ignavibacteriaceae bacterium]
MNKFLADSGVTSRRKAEELIKDGRVSVNDKVVIELSTKINTNTDFVSLDGELIKPKKHVYFLLNKPRGVVTTTSDEKNRKTVVDLVKSNERIYPVGRLDYNTTGVLFLTNDGEFANFLTHPSNKVPREYDVKLDKPLTDHDESNLLNGLIVDGTKSRFTKIQFRNKKDKRFVRVTGIEGKNHYVKKMFGALGYQVLSLNRVSFAGVTVDLPAGSYKKLSRTIIDEIYQKYA